MRLFCAVLAAVLLPSVSASAFCGFYVSGSERELKNSATHVILLRKGTTTVLSMQNDYRGPVRDFAMVVPVPSVLTEDDVRTLPSEVFERVLRLTGPRLVEYWEADPCAHAASGGGTGSSMVLGAMGTIGYGSGGGSSAPRVRVEAQFAVGEYDIEILSADESDALETWLRAHEYRIPEGASEMLRPYVETGMKFFVAKVNVDRVQFRRGRAELSPLRIRTESETFQLPVRLGMLNSSGSQDLIVNVLAENQRYEVANYPNAFIPTNLDMSNATRRRFGAVYDAIFRDTLERNPGAVITEYAWSASSCDPCPTGALTMSEIATLGWDVVGPTAGAEVLHFGNPSIGIQGPHDAAAVRRITRMSRRRLNQCGQGSTHAMERLRVRLEVSEHGRVTHVQAVAAGGIAACVRAVLARMRLPNATGASTITLNYPATRARVVSGGLPPLTLTRLHYRYEPGALNEDLVFRAAEPVEGGREWQSNGLHAGARPAATNNFQARYAIRHPWRGRIRCDNPVRGDWTGEPPRSREVETRGAGRTRPGRPIRLQSYIREARDSDVLSSATTPAGLLPASFGEEIGNSKARHPSRVALMETGASPAAASFGGQQSSPVAWMMTLMIGIMVFRRLR